MLNAKELRNGFRSIQAGIESLVKNKLVVTTLGAIFLVVGFYVRLHPSTFREFKDGLGALCDALVIAAFLSLAVDPILKRELVTDAAKDVFSYAFGYSLPQELRSFVNDLILKTKIVRRRCHLKWKIEPKDDDAKKVRVILEASFFVVNFSDEGLKYQHKVFSWKEDSSDPGCVMEMYCECRDPKDKPKYKEVYRKKQLSGLTLGADSFIRGDEIELGRHTEEDQYRVGAVYYAEAERSGLDQFSILEPTMEIEVTITVNDKLRGLVFSVVPDLSEDKGIENYVLPQRDTKSNQLQHTWQLNRVFVPNERVLIRWK